MIPLNNLGDLVDRGEDPEQLALIDLLDTDNPREFSHREIDEGARALARGLLKRGLAAGDHVAILAENSAEYLISYFGIMRAGMIAVPTNFKFPNDTVDYILRDSGVKLVLADEARRDNFSLDLPTVIFGEAGPDGYDALLDPGPFETVRVSDTDIAMALYTSGSTGRPKGVPLTHSGQVWVISVRYDKARSEDHRLLVAAPFFHMNALFVTKLAMAAHKSIVLLPRFRATAYIEAIGRFGCTWLTSVPTMMALVAQEEEALAKTDLSSVKYVAMGSSPITQKLVDNMRRIFPGARIQNNYGTTEAGAGVFGDHPDGLTMPDTSVGYPLADIGFRLVDGDNTDADQGVMQMTAPAQMPGYLNQPEKTAEAVTGDGYYITGDVMRRDDNGFIYFVGRADDMFVCSGENIYPVEVERVLERHPEIHQACIVPVDDEVRGQKPVAYIVLRPGGVMGEQAVKDFALANAPAYQHPRHVVFVDELPLAGTNKVDRRVLGEQANVFAT